MNAEQKEITNLRKRIARLEAFISRGQDDYTDNDTFFEQGNLIDYVTDDLRRKIHATATITIGGLEN